jgi:hypothetical protein
MGSNCSLRLDLVPGGTGWAWQLFHRRAGINPSLSGLYPFPREIIPADIYAFSAKRDVFGNAKEMDQYSLWLTEKLLPLGILKEIEDAQKGDILFMVPPEWADVPFELLCTSRGKLGLLFSVGTIIRSWSEQAPLAKASRQESLLIIADPAGNLPSAYEEGIRIKEFAKKNQREFHLITSGDKWKILNEFSNAGIVHFSGHSIGSDGASEAGWQLGEHDFLSMRT